MIKKWWKQVLGIGLVGTFITVGDVAGIIGDWYDAYQLNKHESEVALFGASSSIIGHHWVGEGKVQLEYKTCHPPVDTPFYHYFFWVDGAPTRVTFGDDGPYGPRLPASGEQSVESWHTESHCEDGWVGKATIPNVKVGSKIVVVWHFLLDDKSYESVRMEYIVEN